MRRFLTVCFLVLAVKCFGASGVMFDYPSGRVVQPTNFLTFMTNTPGFIPTIQGLVSEVSGVGVEAGTNVFLTTNGAVVRIDVPTVAGVNGTNGLNGTNGVDGVTGPQGEAGPPGPITNISYTVITNAPWQNGSGNLTNWSSIDTNILSSVGAPQTNVNWQAVTNLTDRLNAFGATNTPGITPGTNTSATTNGSVVTINADVSHAEVSASTNDLNTALSTKMQNGTNDLNTTLRAALAQTNVAVAAGANVTVTTNATATGTAYEVAATIPPLNYVASSGGVATNLTIYADQYRTNYTYTDANGWHNTNTAAANMGTDIKQGWIKAQRGYLSTANTLSYSGTNVLVDFSMAQTFKLLVTTNIYLIPTNASVCAENAYIKAFISTYGPWTLVFGTNSIGERFTFSGGIAPTLSTNLTQDTFTLTRGYDETNMQCVLSPNFK